MLSPKRSTRTRRMWRCPACRRQFANRNQSHACGKYRLSAHFQGKPRAVRRLYQLFLRQVRRCGRVLVVPEKTRIAFQVRMSFAAIQVQAARITGHLVLAARYESSCFERIESISKHNHVHHFKLEQPADLNKELCQFIEQAYAVGQQEHLKCCATHGTDQR